MTLTPKPYWIFYTRPGERLSRVDFSDGEGRPTVIKTPPVAGRTFLHLQGCDSGKDRVTRGCYKSHEAAFRLRFFGAARSDFERAAP
jgi:hypothetical protein